MKELDYIQQQLQDDKNILLYHADTAAAVALRKAIPNVVEINSLFFTSPASQYPSFERRGAENTNFSKQKDRISLSAINARKQVKIITLVNDPYERNVSDFFYNFSYWMYKYTLQSGAHARTESDATLVQYIFEKMYDHQYFFNWFDIELKKLTGIDVYQYSFDHAKQYTRIQQVKYDILVLNVQALEELTEVIEDFTGAAIQLNSMYRNSQTWFKDIYKDFCESFTPAESYLDQLYNSKFATHFFSAAQIEIFRTKAINKEIVTA